ncbi:hypothetical protein MNBD_GAMMA11-3441 [hydrothermal vent metagenome]|uniref:Uncharacterized protein n=1 Tax=hydrothermal vent metagenome TaxID=652676 RepID=A0A3B0XC69_9ZZZZ
MNIEIRAAGKLIYDIPQQRFVGDSPEIMQVSYYAGQQMIAIQKSDEQPNLFELHYMGLVAGEFKSMEAAKSSASLFAKEALHKLSKMILE